MEKKKRIGIVGGGPGGLTLARILLTRGIAATVFELDEHSLARPQGGSLDLHAESGLLALHHAGLFDEFKRCARYEDQEDRYFDEHGTLLYEHGAGLLGDRPEIDRTQLRDILLRSLPQETVRWGSKVTAVEPLPSGAYRILGEHGALGDFDLVVGADGAWSKVRPLVSPERPRYTGVTFIELRIEDIDRQHPAIARLVPSGKIGAGGNNKGIIAQRSSNGHLRVYLMFRVPADWIAQGAVDLSSPARARVDLKAQLAGWAPSLLALIDAASDDIVPRPIVALPVGHRWPHRPGVTLLGDAAHVMSPFGGEGVNMAMLDADELALQLAAGADWSRAVASYEERMFVRAAEAAAGAESGLNFLSENGMAHVIEHFKAMQRDAEAAGR
jgi:2-polyprenyl-6-methoxyphenol hydroxylase-like FAD-dependent oxidoreductase